MSEEDEIEELKDLDYFVSQQVAVYRVTPHQMKTREEPAVGNCSICGKPGKAWNLHADCHVDEDLNRVVVIEGRRYYDKCRAVFRPRSVRGDQYAFLLPKFVAKMYGHDNVVANTVVDGGSCLLMRYAPKLSFESDAFTDKRRKKMAFQINFVMTPFEWRRVDFQVAREIQEE